MAQTKARYFLPLSNCVDENGHTKSAPVAIAASPLDPRRIYMRKPTDPAEEKARALAQELDLNQPENRAALSAGGSSSGARVLLSTGEELEPGDEATVTKPVVASMSAPYPARAWLEVSAVEDGVGALTLAPGDEPVGVECSSDNPRKVAVVAGGPVYFRTVVDGTRLRDYEIAPSDDLAHRLAEGESATFERTTWLRAGAETTIEVSA